MSANWWGISASIVAWLGVAVIALAIVGPWIRQCIKRRRRCPKCWHDMSHSPPPGMTCSECGYTAKRERRLYKARRRWKLAFLGVFMLIGAYALNVTPAVKDRGWIAAVPTTALILALPMLHVDVRPYGAPGDTPSWRTELFADLCNARLATSTMWRWQQRWLVERAIKSTTWDEQSWREMDAAACVLYNVVHQGPLPMKWEEFVVRLVKQRAVHLVHVPTRWPADEPLRIHITPSRFGWGHQYTLRVTPVLEGVSGVHSAEWPRRRHEIWFPPGYRKPVRHIPPGLPQGRTYQGHLGAYREWRDLSKPLFDDPVTPSPLHLKIELVRDTSPEATPPDAPVLWSTVASYSIEFVEDVDLVVTPFESAALEAAIRSRIQVRGTSGYHTAWHLFPPYVQVVIPPIHDLDKNVILALSFELMRKGLTVPVGSACVVTENDTIYFQVRYEDELDIFDDCLIDPEEWTLKVRSAPRIAIRHFTGGHYWSGEMAIPVRDVIAPFTPPLRSHPDIHPESH